MDTPNPPIAFDIPHTLVKKWNGFDQTKPLDVPLTRQDIDNLFFAIDENTRATSALQKAIVDFSNGKLDEANASNIEATTRLGLSANRLRLFMNAIMAGADLIT